MSETPSEETNRPDLRRWYWVFLILLGSVVPLLLNGEALAAPWIAEDASILRYVHGAGPLVDFQGPQFGLVLVRFWRPLVTLTWDLQEAWTGIDPVALRCFNLGLHALAALSVGSILRALGATRLAAGVGGLWAATFPFQGGTVLWLAGRTDLLGGALLLTSLAALLRGWRLAGCLLAFAACASKEFGFLLPAWFLVLEWSRGTRGRELLRSCLPVTVTVAVAFAARALALGVLVGGYPAPPTPLAQDLVGFASGVAASAGPSLLALFALGLCGALSRTLDPRVFLAGVAAFLLGVLPLWPLLKSGALSPQNERLFYVAELGLALAMGASLARSVGLRARGLLAPAAVVFALGLRLPVAREDLSAWAEAAEVGEARVAAARRAVEGAAAGTGPVLVPDLPTSHGRAYCLGFGAADRFRIPFPPTPRPIWPWRPVFGFEASHRSPAFPPREDGTLWPFDTPQRTEGLLLPSGPRSFVVDGRVLAGGEDTSPQIQFLGSHPTAGFEVLLVTELGYEPLAWRLAGPGEAHTLGLRELMNLSNGTVSGGQVLMQAADLGATRAFLELRAVGADGGVQGASPWIELTWDPGFKHEVAGGSGS